MSVDSEHLNRNRGKFGDLESRREKAHLGSGTGGTSESRSDHLGEVESCSDRNVEMRDVRFFGSLSRRNDESERTKNRPRNFPLDQLLPFETLIYECFETLSSGFRDV
jgi:hypothetical protein